MYFKSKSLRLKIITRNLKGAKAAAAIDDTGRVLVLISDTLQGQHRWAYALWGVICYLRFRVGFLILRLNSRKPTSMKALQSE